MGQGHIPKTRISTESGFGEQIKQREACQERQGIVMECVSEHDHRDDPGSCEFDYNYCLAQIALRPGT